VSSVTEQMLIHAQEFNTRLDATEQLMQDVRQEVNSRLIELVDKVDYLEYLIKSRKANE
jgi:hypothetical protein|tara:strand:+ start:2348 stop:2524 length:177 start_codon:yes stop_codon:yes gene_type:complete